MVDSMQKVLDLLEDNWNSATTDLIIPSFIKVTDQKRYDFNNNQDVIIAQRVRIPQQPAGIGRLAKRLTHSFDIDIRVFGAGQENHFFNVIDETKKILDDNIAFLTANFDIIDPDSEGIDMSDKTHKVYRFIMPIKLVKYNVTR